MEPVVTEEGFKMLQNPEESRNFLKEYYESLGFQVMSLPDLEHPFSNANPSKDRNEASKVSEAHR